MPQERHFRVIDAEGRLQDARTFVRHVFAGQEQEILGREREKKNSTVIKTELLKEPSDRSVLVSSCKTMCSL